LSLQPKRLGDVAEFIRGITFKPEELVSPEESDAVICMRTKNIQEQLELDDVIAVPGNFVKRSELFLRKGDILISSANSWNLVGKVAQVPNLPYQATAGGFIAIVRAKPGKIDSEYLYRWLASDPVQACVRACGRQTTNISNLSVPRFLGLPIVVPAAGDQDRIASILGKAESLRRKRHEAIRLSDEFLRSIYLDLAKKHPSRASVESVLASIPNAARTGPFGSQLLVSEFTKTGIPVLGIDNVVSNFFTWGARRFISPEKYAELKRYTVRPGDVMVTIMGTTGRVAVAPIDLPLCISTKHLCTLSLDQEKMRSSYLWACLRWDPEVREQTQRESKGAIMEGWNMGIVKSLMVSRPPIDVQLKFETLVMQIEKISKSASKGVDETDAMIASLSAKYLCSPTTVS
jgi:type I restriction enzyme S subunit